MPIIIREKPEHVPLLNGVKFFHAEGFSFSEEVPNDVAENFASVDGYRLASDDELPEHQKPEKPPAAPKLSKAKQAKPEPVVADTDEQF